MTYSAPPGVFDILPTDSKDPWKSSYLWQHVESVIRTLAEDYAFREIRTPMFERTELLCRGVGETSDIVTKEMYTFEDKGGRSMTLRPEGTAPAIRAFIENQMAQQSPLHKLYYIAPMFRYERSQAGRYRQHHQFGVEAIGSESPALDAEVIDMAYSLYQRLGIKNVTLYINSLGTPQVRENYRNALREHLKAHLNDLSADSQTRFEKNPLRILDSKDPKDRAIIAEAPSILTFLDDESRAHFEQVQTLLTALQIPFEVNPLLVRGLDYYNKTVFELVSGNLGAQNSIGGGGRYDGLIKLIGGPDLPAVGFGTGIERILQTMINQSAPLPKPHQTSLFLIPLGEKAFAKAFEIQKELRNAHIPVEMDYSGKKLNKVMSYASQSGATFVGILGEDELAQNEIALKDMASGKSMRIPLPSLQRILEVETRADQFMDDLREMSRPFEHQSESEYFAARLQKNIHTVSEANASLVEALQTIQKILPNP